MKHLILAITLLIGFIGLSQNTNSGFPKETNPIAEQILNDTTIHDMVEVPPSFPGGIEEMKRFIKKNLNYPEETKSLKKPIKCFTRFVVNQDGSLSKITIMKEANTCLACGQEAIRMINLMPKWNPAMFSGRSVRAYYNLPVVFE